MACITISGIMWLSKHEKGVGGCVITHNLYSYCFGSSVSGQNFGLICDWSECFGPSKGQLGKRARADRLTEAWLSGCRQTAKQAGR